MDQTTAEKRDAQATEREMIMRLRSDYLIENVAHSSVLNHTEPAQANRRTICLSAFVLPLMS
jgi:hypothetical protein